MIKDSKLLRKALNALVRNVDYDKDQLLDMILEPRQKEVLSLASEGYLVDIGWFNAIESKEPVDNTNKPIPWITYPAIEFLNSRLKPDMEIFEFGAGNSTMYYASRVASVTAVEHDAAWFAKIKSNLPSNVNLIFRELEYDGDYCRTALSGKGKYDIVIVDGRDRVNCIKQSISSLKKVGIMILDDSQRNEYVEGRNLLKNEGFRHIDFSGINPANIYYSCTTVFYKINNCLEL